MSDNSAFVRYRTALAGFCIYFAELASVQEAIKNGEVVDASKVEETCEALCYYKERFLSSKAEMGFTDGFDFTENNSFCGFRVRDGSLHGEKGKLFAIVRPWYDGFPKKSNNYQFEVANLLLAFMQVENNGQKVPSSGLSNRLHGVQSKMQHILHKVKDFFS